MPSTLFAHIFSPLSIARHFSTVSRLLRCTLAGRLRKTGRMGGLVVEETKSQEPRSQEPSSQINRLFLPVIPLCYPSADPVSPSARQPASPLAQLIPAPQQNPPAGTPNSDPTGGLTILKSGVKSVNYDNYARFRVTMKPSN